MVGHLLWELTDSGTSAGPATELLERLDLERWWVSPGAGPSLDGPDRVAAGLLGVAAGEMYGAGRSLDRRQQPIAHALVDLTNAYTTGRGSGLPLEEARRHAGVEGPAWLLPVALAHPSLGENLVVSTMLLARAAGMDAVAGLVDDEGLVVGDDGALMCCASYVQLAGCVLMGMDPAQAARAGRETLAGIRGRIPSPIGEPMGAADPCGDALAASVWALERGCSLDYLTELVTGVEPAPGVLAAVGGLLGLRDGVDGLPATWRVPAQTRADIEVLVPVLLRKRFRVEKAAVQRAGERDG